MLGFAWRSELLGADGLPPGRYTHSAVALVDAWVHVLPYEVLRRTMARLPGLAARWREALSAQERRANDNAWVLEAHAAEARLARFVIALARRMAELGCSQRHLLLEMTQRDIANHLNLSADGLERAYTGLAHAGLLGRRLGAERRAAISPVVEPSLLKMRPAESVPSAFRLTHPA